MAGLGAEDDLVPPHRPEEAAMPGTVPPIADEREGLLAFLDQQRDGLRYAAFGLTDEEARRTPTAGALSIGGLVKHVAFVERGWIDNILQRRPDPAAAQAAYEDGFRLLEGETLAGALAELDAAARDTEAVIAGIADLGQAVPVPDEPWFPKDVEAWSVRWVLLHLIEEVARHAGHADIVREAIDGAQGVALMAAAEGWPATDWLQPWERATAAA
jgi:uncharacterized damage-inducible protein DinB